MRIHIITALGALLLCYASAVGQQARPSVEDSMRKYDTPYYIMYTDLEEIHAREAAIRMTRMAEEYHERTKSFSGAIREKFPFYLFASEILYYKAGGRPGTAGVFMGSRDAGYRLMALAGGVPDERTWNTVQHEGFHQFAHAVIGGDLPIWVNEGLAEYFGEAVFTGDGFVTGVIPQWRLERIRETMKANGFMPIERMMILSHQGWNQNLTGANYDQAWAMVHFLAHGDDGKYQQPFTKFMKLIGRGARWSDAWLQSFGSPHGFEQKWKKYWTELPDNPTELAYARATLQTMASFLARASIEGQTFADFDAFVAAARADELRSSRSNWLPPSLLTGALSRLDAIKGEWRLDTSVRPARLIFVMDDQTQLVATPVIKGKSVEKISFMTDELPRVIIEARQLVAEGQLAKARTVLQEGMRRDPRSPAIEEARTLMAEIRGSGATNTAAPAGAGPAATP